jgi:hypothetical protein
MGRIYYAGSSITLSQLRSYVECGEGGYTSASSIRGKFFTNPPNGVSSTGSFSGQFRNQWINSRCWAISVDGYGSVAVTSPWYSGYFSNYSHVATYAVTQSYSSWVTLDAVPASNYAFQYWYRVDPYEIWSYSANVSYYIPTDGWQNTYQLTAVFSYVEPPPPQECNTYSGYDEFYEGIDCLGNQLFGYAGWGEQFCAQAIYYGANPVAIGCGGGNCLVGDSVIEMADGTTKLLKDIRRKDIVKSVSISGLSEDENAWVNWSDSTLEYEFNTATVKSITPVGVGSSYSINNGLLIASGTHIHFRKQNGTWNFCETTDLSIGDTFLNKNGQEVEIISIQEIDEKTIVYRLDVENTDLFIANGIITHNRKTEI